MRSGLASLLVLLCLSKPLFADPPLTPEELNKLKSQLPKGSAAAISDAARGTADAEAIAKGGSNNLNPEANKQLEKFKKDGDGDEHGGKNGDDKTVVRRDSEHERKRKEEDEQQRIREWNKQQDKKAYDYRAEQMSGFAGSHGAAAPLYKPSAVDAPSIAPYVAGEFKDAQGNLWKVIEGSPDKLAELSEAETNETSAAPTNEEPTPSRDLDSTPTQEEALPVEETQKSSPNRALLSISAPSGAASASVSVGPQSNTFNIFMNAPTASTAAPAIIRTMVSDSRELAPLEKAPEELKEKEASKPMEGPALTINNNISVEGASLEGGAPMGLVTQARLLLQKALASTKGKTKEVVTPQMGNHDARLSLEASYGSRGLASLEGRASTHSTYWFLGLILLVSGLAISGRELHKNKMWKALLAKFRKTPAVARAVPLKKVPSEATFATSATRIYRR